MMYANRPWAMNETPLPTQITAESNLTGYMREAFEEYAKFEESQMEFERARSMWERAIEVDNHDPLLWINYANFELRNNFVDKARNVFDRALKLFPSENVLWSEYLRMEKILGNVAAVRQIYELFVSNSVRLTNCLSHIALESYLEFELGNNEVERARAIFEQFVDFHPKDMRLWLKFADFERMNGNLVSTRNTCERAVKALGGEMAKEMLLGFAKLQRTIEEDPITLDPIVAESATQVMIRHLLNELKDKEGVKLALNVLIGLDEDWDDEDWDDEDSGQEEDT